MTSGGGVTSVTTPGVRLQPSRSGDFLSCLAHSLRRPVLSWPAGRRVSLCHPPPGRLRPSRPSDSTCPSIIGCLLVYLWGSSGSNRDYAASAPEALVPIQYFSICEQHSQTVSSQPAVSGTLDLPRQSVPLWIVTRPIIDWDRQAEGVAGGAPLSSPQYFTCPTRERARRTMLGTRSTSGYGSLYQASMPLQNCMIR